MKTPMNGLDTWTTDELLDRIQVTTMRALLNDCDQLAAAGPRPPGHVGLLSIGRDNESL